MEKGSLIVMFTIILIASVMTLIQWGLYKIKAGRFFLFILPVLSLCLQICIIFATVREQALLNSMFPLWLRIVIRLLPMLVSLFIMAACIVLKYKKMTFTKPFYHTVIRLFLFFLLCMAIILPCTVYFAQEYVIFFPNHSYEDTSRLMNHRDFTRIDVGNYMGWERKKDSDQVIVYFGGNAQNSATVFREYEEDGTFDILKDYTVISVDYPEYGDSGGTLSQTTLFAMADAVMKYTHTHYPDKKITIIGYSIGSGIACYAAHTYPPDAFVLLSPYSNGQDLFNSYLPIFYGPGNFLIRYPLRSSDYVKDITAPTLILYTKKDTIVRPYLTTRLLSSFPNKPEVIVYPTYTHGDMVTTPAIWKDIVHFLQDHG